MSEIRDWYSEITTIPSMEMYEWLYLNCYKSWYTAGQPGDMHSASRRIVFRNSEDLLLFKLRFSSEL